jgi:hypothetical protein
MRTKQAHGWTALLTAAVTGGVLAAVLAAAPTSARVTDQAPAPAPGPARGLTPGVATLTPASSGTPVADLGYTAASGSVYVQDAFAPLQPVIALGGRLVGGPAVTFTGIFSDHASEQLAVFGRGTDGALWWRHQTASGRWTSWQSLGGRLTSQPAVAASDSTDTLSVLVRGTDGAIWYRTMTGTRWDGWTRLGGNLLPGTAPTAVYGFNGQLMVAAVGPDREIWLFTDISGSRSAEYDLGGQTTQIPALTFMTGTAQAPNTPLVVVYVTGTDDALWAKQATVPVTTARGAWRSLGGRLTSGIAASTNGGPFSYVFALGTDSQFWMRVGGWPSLGSWTRA